MSEQAAAPARKSVVSRRRAGQLSARKNVVSRRRVPASRSAVGQEECGQQTPCSGKQVSCRPGIMWSADAVFRQAGQLSGPRLQTTR